MVRASKMTLSLAGQYISRRRRNRFTPSIAESASSLEDRVLLSGAGGKAHAAEVARPMADTAAGHRVTAAFESILGTNPSSAQLTQWVHKLHSGVSIKALDRDLRADAQTQAAAAVTANAIANDPEIFPTTIGGTSSIGANGGFTSMSNLPTGLTTSIGSTLPSAASSLQVLSQVPAGMAIQRAFASPTSGTSLTGSTIAGLTGNLGSTSASSLTSLIDTLVADGLLSGNGTGTGMTGTSSTAVNTAINSLLANGSLTGLAAQSSPAVASALNSLLTSGVLTQPGSTGTTTTMTPTLNTLIQSGAITGNGGTSLNSTTLPEILGALLSNGALTGSLGGTTTGTTIGTGTTGTSTSSLVSLLDTLLAGGMTSTSTSSPASLLGSLLAGGTTTTTGTTGTEPLSPLASLLSSGSIPTAGSTSVTI